VISYSIESSVATIKLNRPEKYNAFVREMSLGLQEALRKAQQDENVRSVFITGEGKAFCAGQDLAEAISPDGPGIRKIVAEHYNPIITLIRTMEKPVVCAVNGVAAGAGANVALACDIVVAGTSSAFIQAFSKIGLVPDSGGTYFLPRLVGMQKAAALMMLGEKVSGPEAEAMGMIYKCFDDDTLLTEGYKIAVTLAQLPTKGLGLTKKLLNLSLSNNLQQQLTEEEIYQAEAGQSTDHKEGVAAFLEKRKPAFTGK
jgi:2-(1,2-epoxy-1,2-dihydrophenyl)acetyl-CoA isomerase